MTVRDVLLLFSAISSTDELKGDVLLLEYISRDAMRFNKMCWGDPLTPEKFVQKYNLPQVVKVREDYLVEGAAQQVALNQPLLLYKTYHSRKVHARMLDKDENGAVTEVGPSLLIPDSYEGWLSVITDEGRTAGYFTSIHEIVTAEVPYFLTRDEILGFRLSRKSGSIKFSKIKVNSGEVLQFLGMHESTSYLLRHTESYAKVINRHGDLILLRLESSGKFYAVAGRRTRGIGYVYQIAQLLRLTNLPLDVRIVSGTLPTLSRPFTGLLRMERIEENNVILACAVKHRKQKSTLFEMDIDSSFLFLRPLNRPDILTSRRCNKMLNFSRTREFSWRNEIKVAHHVIPARQEVKTYEDEEHDSAVRCSVKSFTSSSSKPSSSSSFMKRLRTLQENWKRQRSLRPSGSRKLMSSSATDFHMYERVNTRNSWSLSSLSTEILEDHGYATSDFDELSSSGS